MSTNFYFKSATITNFRIFRELTFAKAKRINLISGLNAAGKSAFMETLFLSLDLNNPACLIRPFQWRGIPLTGDDLPTLFHSDEQVAEVSLQTRTGKVGISLAYGSAAQDLVVNASQNVDLNTRNMLLNSTKGKGVSITATFGQAAPTMQLFVNQSGDTINATGRNMPESLMPPASYLAQFLPIQPQELSARVSQVIKKGRRRELINYIKTINPTITDIEVLQEGITAQVHVMRGDEVYRPLALMGGGLRAFVEMVSCVMISNGGVVFIDELDSTLHFSVVSGLWEILATICYQENVQVFAVTHSRETLASAAGGVSRAGRGADFQYVRIDEVHGRHECTHYSIDELKDALEFSVEIR